VSAARLASDQAAIEKAQADLVDARQQLRQAVLRSTRSGRVVSVPVTAGDRVSADDVGAVVVGGRAVTVVASVAQDKISRVAVGEHVRVTTPGQSGAADGTVSAIGLVADSSSGTPSYAVTVTVEDPTISLPAGSQALLGVVVATAKDVVTVPTSAITRRGTQATVRTWDGRTLTRKTVTLGTVGARQVEITAGLAAGDRVVLADIDQPITGASNSINDRGGFSGPVNFKGGGPGGPPVTFGTPAN
jgi:HlyD family secretion protein